MNPDNMGSVELPDVSFVTLKSYAQAIREKMGNPVMQNRDV